MPRSFRHRSSSAGSYQDGSNPTTSGSDPFSPINASNNAKKDENNPNVTTTTTTKISPEDLEVAKTLLNSLLYLKDDSGKSYLHSKFNLVIVKALLDRARSVEVCPERNNNVSMTSRTYWQRRFLLQADEESGYTPFHRAILEGNLAAMLLLLRQAMDQTGEEERFTQRPMNMLHAADDSFSGSSSNNNNNNNNRATTDLIYAMANARDHEGLTPLELLGKLQESELSRCRRTLDAHTLKVSSATTNTVASGHWSGRFGGGGNHLQQHRQPPVMIPPHGVYEDVLDYDEDLDFLRANLSLLSNRQDDDASDSDGSQPHHPRHDKYGGSHSFSNYACEVVTFGRPHHCALGVVQGSNSTSTKEGNHFYTASTRTFRLQRVQEFAKEAKGIVASAVAVAAANHHTLVALKNGELYAFGVGKGGRLGIGDDQPQQCPLPRRVLGPLSRRKVIDIAAAENHSLCVTSDGTLFAWGSNRFGQLGDTTSTTGNNSSNNNNSSSSSNNSNNCRCFPRRVEDMKQVPCVAVAAGEKHSVALSREGEVYVWGDNTAGQLGVARRTGIQKPQRVEALWKNGGSSSSSLSGRPKVAIAIAAAEQSTLVLTLPTPGMTYVNSVYAWGHGNHVPIRVQFGENQSSSQRQQMHHQQQQQQGRHQKDMGSLSAASRRVVNPVSIACAKYHNVAITSDGHVYTWGLHAESLGRSKNDKGDKTTTTQPQQHQQRRESSGGGGGSRSISSPQLVTGMLPENGGGFVVAVSASEQHTAVVTDCGALYTWGSTHGSNVLGHKGVRWQPSPKRVPGVHRAVRVAVGKEHTVLLIGASFPPIESRSEKKENAVSKLELLAAQKVAEHVDLFNVIPILIMAERTECLYLVKYCTEFIRRNLDGVLNLGKKSELNQYLNDMLADAMHRSGWKYREDHHHPFITDVITAGSPIKPSFHRDWLSGRDEWILACKHLSQTATVQRLLAHASRLEYEEDVKSAKNRTRRASSDGSAAALSRRRSSSFSSEQIGGNNNGSSNANSRVEFRESNLDKCIKKTANMDLSTSELAKENSIWLGKEIRGIRKKLNQIAKLQESEKKSSSIVLTTEQRTKVERRPTLEAELMVYETALDDVQRRIKELLVVEQEQEAAVHQQQEESSSASKANRVTTNQDKTPSSADGIDNVIDDKEKEEEKEKASSKDDTTDEGVEKDDVPSKTFSCEICGIRCPDKTSYELHVNGRKHRNRVAQVAEEEKRKVAASIQEQRQLEQVKNSNSSTANTSTLTTKKKKNAWGMPPGQPKFKLPPPPHPALPQVPVVSAAISAGKPKKTMTASTNKAGLGSTVTATNTKAQRSSSNVKATTMDDKIQFPSLSATVVSSPLASPASNFKQILHEQEMAKKRQQQQNLKMQKTTKISTPKKSQGSVIRNISGCGGSNRTPTATTPSSSSKPSPVWSSPPTSTSTRCVPLSLYAATPSSSSAPSPSNDSQQQQQRASFSLGDFLAPSKASSTITTTTTTTTTTPAKKFSLTSPSPWSPMSAWSSLSPNQTNAVAVGTPDKNVKMATTPTTRATTTAAAANTPSTTSSAAAAAAVSLKDIQAEEADFKTREDQNFGQSGGCWYIDRRERADSLVAIQTVAEKEREERLFVEEQIRIEALIKKEQNQQQQQQKKQEQREKANKKKNKRKSKSNKNNNNNKVGSGGGETKNRTTDITSTAGQGQAKNKESHANNKKLGADNGTSSPSSQNQGRNNNNSNNNSNNNNSKKKQRTSRPKKSQSYQDKKSSTN